MSKKNKDGEQAVPEAESPGVESVGGSTDEDTDFLKKARDFVAKRKETEKSEDTGPKVHEGNQLFNGDVMIRGALCVRSADGISSIQISPMDSTAGIWIRSEGKGDKYPNSCVSIYDGPEGPVIGFWRDTEGDDKVASGMAMDFAIGIDAKSKLPSLQVANGRGGFGSVNLAELLDKVMPGWR